MKGAYDGFEPDVPETEAERAAREVTEAAQERGRHQARAQEADLRMRAEALRSARAAARPPTLLENDRLVYELWHDNPELFSAVELTLRPVDPDEDDDITIHVALNTFFTGDITIPDSDTESESDDTTSGICIHRIFSALIEHGLHETLHRLVVNDDHYANQVTPWLYLDTLTDSAAEIMAHSRHVRGISFLLSPIYRPISENALVRLTAVPTIEKLDLTNCSLTGGGVQAIASSTTLKDLVIPLDFNPTFAEQLSHNTSITSLAVSKYRTSSDIITLARNETIRDLFLGKGTCEVADLQALAANSTMEKLNLFQTSFGPEGVGALGSSTTLKTLTVTGDFDLSTLFPTGGPGFYSPILDMPAVTELHLCWVNLTSEDVEKLANNKILRSLCLQYINPPPYENEGIHDDGVRALARNKTLTTLQLFSNKVSDVGAQALAINKTLTSLDLSDNKVKNAGAQALAFNRTLKKLKLFHNEIGEEGALAFERNVTLEYLTFHENDEVTAVTQRRLHRPPL
jgi:hypothetical protein